ncbi:microtubule-associated protein 70-5 [Punica granatum]|uniref:Microtubule-associated protein 70-5 n=1 Tax=Punica granatum TaxID=22663 RepID=A0A6P8DEV6_PUNGR|nr:microtubule-associated protein 70-5 [Punica granatum]XP_031395115.1 microtubule-associated protein 70-5 [Punica granatum]XP_031395116.1 microtubule-associated protein 70-5 [Punica granatum]
MSSEENFFGGGGGGELSVSQPNPVVLELDRLQNLLREKGRELGAAQSKIKSLKAAEILKDKAIEELKNEVDRLEEKLRASEKLLEHKNLEIKKLGNERKDALAAQYAAEATLRRLHMNQKDDDLPPIESVLAPLESELKMYKNEVAALQEDKKALERLTKSKESALIEAERILRSALERALIVEEVQNQNYELKRQIEICQEENRILEKTNRQKVVEVEKLSQTIQDLEEAILAGGAAANAIRDYKRQISELNEEKRTLERELARVKVSANRVAAVVANEWKDENDKVMPVKQWLEERRILQAEMQKLRDKLAISERTAKAEAQLKDKLKLRLKTLEDGLRQVSSLSTNPNSVSASPITEQSNHIFGFLTSNGGLKKRSSSQPRGSSIRSTPLIQPNSLDEPNNHSRKKFNPDESIVRRSLWASRSKVVDSSGKENSEKRANSDENIQKFDNKGRIESNASDNKEGTEDAVSGFLYDRLQKEVISLRKFCEAKDSSLNAKDQEIMMLMKKVDALTKSIEVESKKQKREAAMREKEAAAAAQKVMDDKRNIKSTKSSK